MDTLNLGLAKHATVFQQHQINETLRISFEDLYSNLECVEEDLRGLERQLGRILLGECC